MRIVVLVAVVASWLIGGAPAVFAQEGSLTLAGAGVMVAMSPYQGVGAKVRPVPFLKAEHKGFYIKGIEAGYHFLKQGAWKLSLVTSPRFMGYHSSDSAQLAGMEDRRWSLDAGLRAQYALPLEGMSVSAKAVGDVLSRSGGAEYGIALEQTFKGRIFQFMPSAGVKYQSRDLVDYYYGVRDNEVAADRPVYAPSGMFVPFADAMFTFGISRRLIVMTRAGVEFLGTEARKSPIVGKGHVASAAAGLTYMF